MKNQRCCSGAAIATAASAITVALSESLTLDEQNILGNLLVQVGDSLLAIAAIDAVCEEKLSSETKCHC